MQFLRDKLRAHKNYFISAAFIVATVVVLGIFFTRASRIVAMLIALTGCCISSLAYRAARKAEEHSKVAEKNSAELVGHLLKEVSDFSDFARRANEEFIVQDAGTTMMSLISPAFGALSTDGGAFESFNECLLRLLTAKQRKLQVIVAAHKTLEEWHRGLIQRLVAGGSGSLEHYKEVVVSCMKRARCTYSEMVSRNLCELKTRETTLQMFVRMDASGSDQRYKCAMLGFLGSDMHKRLREMRGQDDLEYDTIEDLSKGFFSMRVTFVKEQERCFKHIWGNDSALCKNQIETYFDNIISAVHAITEGNTGKGE